MRRHALARLLPIVVVLCGCAANSGGARLFSPVDDYASYRRVRLATTMGARLRAAKDYLEARPDGAFAAELRRLFEAEEPEYFEAAKASRLRTLDYLTHLPDGPNRDAAQSLMLTWDIRIEEGEAALLLSAARRTEATLAAAALQRQAVGETLFEALRTVSDAAAYGAALEDAPAPLRRFLAGSQGPTWGQMPRTTTRDLFFVVPTQRERESRVATLTLSLRLESGRVRSATVSGQSLFLHWLEADSMTPLDPTVPGHRARAAAHAKERLEGFFEGLLPRDRCTEKSGDASREESALVARSCDGWRLRATAGAAPTEEDAVTLMR